MRHFSKLLVPLALTAATLAVAAPASAQSCQSLTNNLANAEAQYSTASSSAHVEAQIAAGYNEAYITAYGLGEYQLAHQDSVQEARAKAAMQADIALANFWQSIVTNDQAALAELGCS